MTTHCRQQRTSLAALNPRENQGCRGGCYKNVETAYEIFGLGSTEMSWKMSAFLGVLYIVVYLAFVVLVPMLLLAALLVTLLNRRRTIRMG